MISSASSATSSFSFVATANSVLFTGAKPVFVDIDPEEVGVSELVYYPALAPILEKAGDDEEMLKDCQCVNEFAEAALVMQSLRMGGQDLVCSSGAGRPLR